MRQFPATLMLSTYCLLSFAATISLNAGAHPLQAAVLWMAEPAPFDPLSVNRNFAAGMGSAKCGDQQGHTDCIAVGDHAEMRWRANSQKKGSAETGYLRLALNGCVSRREVEEVLAAPLRLDASGVPDRSTTITLSTRHWTPDQTWRVDLAFNGDCATILTMATVPF